MGMNRNETIQVEKSKWDFLVGVYFGSSVSIYEVCSERAYLDLCRTWSYDKSENRRREQEKHRNDFRGEVVEEFAGKIMFALNSKNGEEYNNWHEDICEFMIEKAGSEDCGEVFTLGHAQKWINMAMKYLYVLQDHKKYKNQTDIKPILQFLHIPLDSIVFKAVKYSLFETDENGYIELPEFKAWSKIDNYTNYLDFQIRIQKKIRDIGYPDPILWEFDKWLEFKDTNK